MNELEAARQEVVAAWLEYKKITHPAREDRLHKALDRLAAAAEQEDEGRK